MIKILSIKLDWSTIDKYKDRGDVRSQIKSPKKIEWVCSRCQLDQYCTIFERLLNHFFLLIQLLSKSISIACQRKMESIIAQMLLFNKNQNVKGISTKVRPPTEWVMLIIWISMNK